jgi:hypothetical protein
MIAEEILAMVALVFTQASRVLLLPMPVAVADLLIVLLR